MLIEAPSLMAGKMRQMLPSRSLWGRSSVIFFPSNPMSRISQTKSGEITSRDKNEHSSNTTLAGSIKSLI